jgi:hypothetical protein
MQGHLFGRPCPADEFEALLKKRETRHRRPRGKSLQRPKSTRRIPRSSR